MTEAYLDGYMYKQADPNATGMRDITLNDLAEIHARRATPNVRKGMAAGAVTGASIGAYSGREDLVKALRRGMVGGGLGLLAGGALPLAYHAGKAREHADQINLTRGSNTSPA